MGETLFVMPVQSLPAIREESRKYSIEGDVFRPWFLHLCLDCGWEASEYRVCGLMLDSALLMEYLLGTNSCKEEADKLIASKTVYTPAISRLLATSLFLYLLRSHLDSLSEATGTKSLGIGLYVDAR